MSESFLNDRITLHSGCCLDVLARLDAASVDTCVTDPPYHLVSIVKRFGADNAAPAKPGKTGAYTRASAGFMGKKWDGGDIAFQPETWAAIFRVLKPGAHLVAFGGTRTYHRMACAIEDAGFEIRDQLAWCYGSGFPKSHDVSKGIDRAAGVEREVVRTVRVKGGGTEYINRTNAGTHDYRPATDAARQWSGWGTALKPAWEPIVLARKPLIGTVAENVLAHGTGALNVDGCLIATQSNPENRTGVVGIAMQATGGAARNHAVQRESIARTASLGRWPANLVHDGSEEVLAGFPDAPGQQRALHGGEASKAEIYGKFGPKLAHTPRGDSGSAARFFYTAKADADDRLGSKHPTVKPLDLMQWLVRLVTPPGGLVLDPFAGTGTTGEAAWREGMRAVLIEREPEYQADVRRRLAHALSGPDERIRQIVKAKGQVADAGPLFAEPAYDANKDFAGSLNEGYAAIRARMAAGGKGWEPR